MGKYYLGQESGTQTNFSVVDASGVISDLDLSGLYLSATGALTSGSELLYGDGSGRFANATIGSGLLFSGGVLHATGAGGGGGNTSGSLYADFIQFNTGTTGAGTTPVGELEWADDLGTLKLGLKGGNITHYIGQQLHERIVNKTTGTLAKGTVVFVSGAQGNRITVEKAIATADTTSATVFGVVAESIASEAEGFVTQDGLLQGLNTTGFTEGAILWLSPTVSGALTQTKPIAPDHLVMVGFCVRSHATVGEILVKVQNGYEIDELHNVRLTGVTNGQFLAYNSASGVWYNANLTGGANISVTSDGSSSVTISTTSGSYTGNFVGTASNADLLDNLDSTYFRNAANLSGTARLSGFFTGSFSGNLTGTASNADFLDSLDSSYFRNGANLTGTINATQLNSQAAAYYLNYANLTGTPRVSGFFTGTLSGTASNADFLDNLDSTYFRNAANLSGTAQLSGSFTGSFSGNLTGTASNADFLDNLDSSYFRNGANLTGTINATQLNSQAAAYYLNYANFTGTPQVSGSFTGTLSGTASNADFLDNFDSTYFRNGANLTGTINATQLNSQAAAYYLNYANLTGTPRVSGFFTGTLTGTASNADFLDNLDSTYFRNAANLSGTAQLSGSFTGSFSGNLTGTASNADFLDNLDSSYFRNAANLTGTINAAQLNGQAGSYYRDAANLSGTAQLSGSFTGLFSGNLTGTASNADFLDNLDSTYFRNAANLTGTASLSGTFSGVFRSDASTTGSASINLPHGTAPTSPVDGDLWTTNSGLYVQISGSSIGPLTTGGGGGGADEFARTIALIGL